MEFVCFSPLTGIPWFPTFFAARTPLKGKRKFQSPDGDSVVSHTCKQCGRVFEAVFQFQSPDGDSVVSHNAVDNAFATGKCVSVP